jgi:transposase InsO family protein
VDAFYLFNETPIEFAAHAAALSDFDLEYDEVRPRQSLGYLTPMEYNARWKAAHAPA